MRNTPLPMRRKFGQLGAINVEFTMRLLIVLFVTLTASSSGAEPVEWPIITPSGDILEVLGPDGYGRSLTVGGVPFFADDGYAFVNVEDRRGALYLLGLSDGGTACGVNYVWLDTTAGNLHTTPQFGNCNSFERIESDAETVTVVIRSALSTEGLIGYVYDGRTVTEVPLGQDDSFSPPSAGGDPWIDRYPFELFQAADWRETLITLMGEEDYARAGATIQLSGQMAVEGKWVVGEGCVKYDCDTTRGAVAVHRTDGRILVVLRNPDRGVAVWGDPQGPFPLTLQRMLDQ